MKKIFFTLILNCFLSFSQSSNYDKIDDFTGNRNVAIGINNASTAVTHNVAFQVFYSGNKSGASSKFIKLYLSTNAILCYSNSDLILLFEDGTKTLLSQISKTDCGKTAVVTYRLKDSDIFLLTNQKISKLRIYSTDGYFDAEIRDKKKQQIIDAFIKMNMTFPN